MDHTKISLRLLKTSAATIPILLEFLWRRN